LLNLITKKLTLKRVSPFNSSNIFDEYTKECDYKMAFDDEGDYRGFYMHSAGNLRVVAENRGDTTATLRVSFIETHYPVTRVAEVVTENYPVPMKRIGVPDRFGEVGSIDYLKGIFGMTKDDIIKAAKDILSRKA